ncbi:MAG: Hpt domain-containing protein [Pseudomonadota bacterium]
MNEAIDFSALNWVRQELGETLKQGRQFLEEYAEGDGNADSLHNCMARLHEARGPLRMVELHGADLLAAEMEEVVNDLIHKRIAEPAAAQEVLMQAFLQLPDYLSRLKSGEPGKPDVLLPSINALRAARESEPLAASVLFNPDLTLPLPASAFTPGTAADVQLLAKAQRPVCQAGMLQWYRGDEGNSGLQEMHAVLSGLQEASDDEKLARLWWLGAGFVEALMHGTLETTIRTKQLFGQVDRQIKQLIDSGETVFSELVPDALLKELLFTISGADDMSGRIGEIRHSYHMQSTDAGSVAGCSAELLATVSATAIEELTHISEKLDIFIRTGMQDMADLEPLAEQLQSLSNSVAMIGLDEAGQTLSDDARCVREICEQGQSSDETGLMSVASGMIEVQAALTALRDGKATAVQADADGTHGYTEGLDAVVREVVSDMAAAREHINDYLRQPENAAVLHDVLALLNQVSGGLRLAGQEEVASLVASIDDYVAHHLVNKPAVPGSEMLDTLADAICSIEFYVEELNENRLYGDTVLEVARNSVAKLDEMNARPADAAATAVVDVVDESPAETSEAPATNAVQNPSTVISGLQIVAADADPEILEIFIEEAAGELAGLAGHISRWQVDLENRDTLEAIRRSFHTLKGSGRMVGVLALGEFSWELENLLNRVLDGTIPADAQLAALYGEASTPLSELLAQVRDGSPVQTDVDGMVTRLHAFTTSPVAEVMAQPEPVAESVTVAAETGVQEPPVAGTVNAGADNTNPAMGELPALAADADPEIVEIFMEEAWEAHASIAELLLAWVASPENNEALEAIRRSFHTLKGSGRMAGAMRVGEFSWSIEDLLNRVIDDSVSITDGLVSMVGGITGPLAELLQQVDNGPEPQTDIGMWMNVAASLARGEHASIDDVSDIVDAGLQPSQKVGETVDVGEVAEPDTVVVDEVVAGEMPAQEQGLLDIFCRECGEQLEVIATFFDDCVQSEVACMVSAPLYRALHTLSGSSESAGVSAISHISGALYTCIGELEELGKPVAADILNVLHDGGIAMAELVARLPDKSFDAGRVDNLLAQITALTPLTEPVTAAATADIEIPDVVDENSDPVDIEVTAESEAVADAVDSVAGQETGDTLADIDPELLESFIEEAAEIIDSSETTLRAWSESPGQANLMEEFQRQLHTLKGGARMVGFIAIGNLSHSLESLLDRVVDGHVPASEKMFGLLQDAHDRLAVMLDQVREHQLPEAVEALETRLDQHGTEMQDPVEATTDITEVVDTEAVAEAGESVVVDTEAVAEADVPVVEEPAAAVVGKDDKVAVMLTVPAEPPRESVVMPHRVERRKQSRVRGDQVRVQSEVLDNLVNNAGEINIYRSRLEQQINVYRFNLAELDQTINRLRDQLRQMEIETETQILFRHEQDAGDRNKEFDPLEMDRYSNLQQLSRSLIESISDLHSIQEMLDSTTRESETLLLQQSRVSTDLQEGLLHTRMVPFASLAPRLRRIVRQSASELGKNAELSLDGADGEMDRTVIERIIAPLEHMLRNAVAHGIEKSPRRKQLGKPSVGTVMIAFHREGPEIVLQISDDGGGVDLEAVRARALERGMIDPDTDYPDGEVMQLILQTGFSTASEVTQLTGRGVGMDVVNSEVKQLGGSLHIDSKTGKGTVFTVRLPYTLAINQALLVQAGDDPFCLPLGGIESVVRVDREALLKCYASDECVLEYGGNNYQLKHLGGLLGTGDLDTDTTAGSAPVLLARVGETRVALQVEAMIGNREIVVKPLGAQLSSVTGVSGATILGDGRVVMILDLPAIVRMGGKRGQAVDQRSRQQKGKLVVMVVDDSITVRKVTTRLLERRGFEVITAKDGVDAMGVLQDSIPDMMLLDIEMPRMDGFELATHMRNDERLRHIPITMITSRAGDKHRERAAEIGVNHYLGKPYQEHELLGTVNQLVGMSDDMPATG